MATQGFQTDFTGVVDAVVVVRADARRVGAWVERGTVPAYVIDLEGPWCAVVPAGTGHARAPYDDPALTLASRPVPMTMRSSLAFFPRAERSVVVVQARRWRALPRWFVVERGVGPIRAQLPQAVMQDLLDAGVDAHPEALARVLAQHDAEPVELLRGLMAALGVPAGHLLGIARHADLEARLVEPQPKAVRRFEKHVAEEREERAEIEGWSQG